jgi:uncharacterized protein
MNPQEQRLRFKILTGEFAVSRLEKDDPIPGWVVKGDFFSITRTDDELSLVCLQRDVPPGIQSERGWMCLKVEGPLDFSLTGILASLTVPLARGGISVFILSTHDTDYLLVKEEKLRAAVDILIKDGHVLKE